MLSLLLICSIYTMNTQFLMLLSLKIEIAPLLLHLVICSEISHPCLLDDFYPVRIH